jgi:hypothetical protein
MAQFDFERAYRLQFPDLTEESRLKPVREPIGIRYASVVPSTYPPRYYEVYAPIGGGWQRSGPPTLFATVANILTDKERDAWMLGIHQQVKNVKNEEFQELEFRQATTHLKRGRRNPNVVMGRIFSMQPDYYGQHRVPTPIIRTGEMKNVKSLRIADVTIENPSGNVGGKVIRRGVTVDEKTGIEDRSVLEGEIEAAYVLLGRIDTIKAPTVSLANSLYSDPLVMTRNQSLGRPFFVEEKRKMIENSRYIEPLQAQMETHDTVLSGDRERISTLMLGQLASLESDEVAGSIDTPAFDNSVTKQEILDTEKDCASLISSESAKSYKLSVLHSLHAPIQTPIGEFRRPDGHGLLSGRRDTNKPMGTQIQQSRLRAAGGTRTLNSSDDGIVVIKDSDKRGFISRSHKFGNLFVMEDQFFSENASTALQLLAIPKINDERVFGFGFRMRASVIIQEDSPLDGASPTPADEDAAIVGKLSNLYGNPTLDWSIDQVRDKWEIRSDQKLILDKLSRKFKFKEGTSTGGKFEREAQAYVIDRLLKK